MSVNLGTAVGYLDLDTSKFQKGFKNAESSLSSFEGKSGQVNSVFSKIGSAATKAAAMVGTGIAASATAIGALAKKATDSYGSYEQLTGGIETLFGAQGMSLKEYASSVGKSVGEVKDKFNVLQKAQSTAMKNASEAYKTAGLSANEYMETVTSFAASLKQSTKNELEAAKSANQAVIDMSDNANKMGTSMESIQNAYQGFAKQNYTMLDNLKLGYGGTKEEMQRLLKDAEKLSGQKYDISNLNDVYNAIHVVQTELGITGTTAKEASTTIEGSANMMKASWENLLTGMGDKEANLGQLIDNFVNSVGTYINNMMPVFTQAVEGIGQLIEGLAPVIGEQLPGIVQSLLPSLVNASVSLIASLVSALPQILQTLYSAIQLAVQDIGNVINEQVPSISEMLTGFTEIAVKIYDKIGAGIRDNLPMVTDMVLGVLSEFANGFAENGPTLLQSGIEMLKNVAQGIADSLPSIAEKVPQIIATIATTIISSAPDILQCGIEIVVTLAKGIVSAIPELVKSVPKMVSAIIDAYKNAKSRFDEIGNGIIDKIVSCIKSGLGKLGEASKQMLNSIVNGLKQLPTKIAHLLSVALGNIAKWSINMANKGKEAGTKFLNNVVNFVKELPGKVSKFLTNVVDKAIQFAKDFPENAKNAASDFGKLLKDSLKSLPGDMLTIGKNIIDGVVNGVKSAWESAKKVVTGVANGFVQGFKDALGIHSPSKVMKDQVGVQMANGVIEGVKSRKGAVKQTAEALSKEIVDAATKRLDVLQTYNKISVQQEVGYWKRILDSTSKGTDAHLQAYKSYKQAIANANAEILSSAEKRLDKLQTYNKISTAGEYAYWKDVLSQLKKGSDEYLTAYKNMISAKQAYNQELKDLETEYADKVQSVYDTLQEKVDSLTTAYNQQVESRKNALIGAFSLFDSYQVETDKTGNDLLDALQSQVSALAQYNSQMAQLEGRNVLPDDLVQSLRDMGLDATGELMSLNQMTDEQLQQYAALWKARNQLAQEEANRENLEAYNKLQSDIEKAQQTAYNKLDKLQTKYTAKIKKMKEEAYDASKLVGTKTVQGIINGIESKEGKLKQTLQSTLDTVTSYVSKINSMMASVQSASSSHTHRNGLSYVPYDGYQATLHEGEKVLTKEEAQADNKGGDTYIFNSPKAIDEKEAARQMMLTKRQLILKWT